MEHPNLGRGGDGRGRRIPMEAYEELVSFIGTSFRSVWALEMLCALRRHGDESCPPAQLVENLRASDLVVRTGLAELLAAGLVSVDPSGAARYAPATAEIDRLATEAEQLYAKSPDAVRRIIVKAANPGLAAFSDAFRLGGNE